LRLRVSVISKLDSHELTAETATSSSNYAWDITSRELKGYKGCWRQRQLICVLKVFCACGQTVRMQSCARGSGSRRCIPGHMDDEIGLPGAYREIHTSPRDHPLAGLERTESPSRVLSGSSSGD
jgi:hypothetical protein